MGVLVGSLAKNPKRNIPTKKKTIVYTEIFRASMELLVLTDLYPIKFIIKLWLIVYFLYFWKILKYFKGD